MIIYVYIYMCISIYELMGCMYLFEPWEQRSGQSARSCKFHGENIIESAICYEFVDFPVTLR